MFIVIIIHHLIMSSILELKQIGATVVRNLRKQKLSSGQPFLINSENLPEKQSYLEYPDNSIKIVSVASGGKSFTEVRKLSLTEANAIRKMYNLI